MGRIPPGEKPDQTSLKDKNDANSGYRISLDDSLERRDVVPTVN